MNKFLGIVVAICVVIQAIDAYNVTCTYTKSENTVTCSGGSKSVKCTTGEAGAMGPAPNGKYRISIIYRGEGFTNGWHQLFPKSKTSNTYYGYHYKNPDTNRSEIAFHEESASGTHGCIMVEAACYAKFEPIMLKATWAVTKIITSKGWRKKWTIGDMTVS